MLINQFLLFYYSYVNNSVEGGICWPILSAVRRARKREVFVQASKPGILQIRRKSPMNIETEICLLAKLSRISKNRRAPFLSS